MPFDREFRFVFSLTLGLSTCVASGCTGTPAELDAGGVDTGIVGDAEHFDGSASRVDAGRYPDGAPVILDAARGVVLDGAALADVGLGADSALDGAPPRDGSADGSDPFDGLVLDVGPIGDGALVFDAPFRPDGMFGISCGGSICPEGLTCCPMTGICVPFGCGECCMPPPPPPPF